MHEDMMEKLTKEKEAHVKTKIQLEIVIQEKEELQTKIENLADSISTIFSKVITSFYLPLLITILNYYIIIKRHPIREILVVQIALSIIIAFGSIYMGVTGRGLAGKLKRILKKAVYKLFGIRDN
jgi:hypothetical protein